MSLDLIVQYLTGAWYMMTGRKDGLAMLDTSADGFWNSFFAIIVAIPPLLLSWIAFTNNFMPSEGASKFGWLAGLALVDLCGWIVPLILFAVVAKPAGLADRFAAYVVATNWGSALVAWLALPSPLTRLLFPGNDDAAASTGLLIFIISLVLGWQLTNAALQRGAAVATAVFLAMTITTVVIMVQLQDWLGLSPVSG